MTSPLSAPNAPWSTARAPILVLGGAYAGKSELAISALAPDKSAVVLGTAAPRETAFAARLQQLKALRPPVWESIDCGRDLAAAIDEAAGRTAQILVDSISQWLAGLLVEGTVQPGHEPARADSLTAQVTEVLQVVAAHPAVRFVFVSAEVGGGPPPARPLERLYRQQLGLANQRLAAVAKTVYWVTAGLPLALKE